MQNKQFYEDLVSKGKRSDGYISFVASLDGKEISFQDFLAKFRKVPQKKGSHGGRCPSKAKGEYAYLVENGIITKPKLL